MNTFLVTDGIFRRAGTERVICQLSQQLSQHCSVTVVVPGSTDAAFPAAERRMSLNMGEFPQASWIQKIWHRIVMAKRLYVSLKGQSGSDCVLCSFTFDVSIVAIIVGWALRHRVVVSEHICFGYHQRGVRRLLRRVLYSLGHVQLIVLTESDRIQFEQIGIAAKVIPNFVEQQEPLPCSVRSSKRPQKTLLMVGRHSAQKDFEFALQAFSLSALHARSWRMIIVGAGELFDHNRAVCEALGLGDFVEFVGEADNVHLYYKSADLFCLTSKFEAFPMVLLEAISFGLPVLAVDCPTGPREILGSDDQVIPRDVDSFARALVVKGDSAEWRSCASFVNRRRAADFAPEAIMEKMMDVISCNP